MLWAQDYQRRLRGYSCKEQPPCTGSEHLVYRLEPLSSISRSQLLRHQVLWQIILVLCIERCLSFAGILTILFHLI